MTPDDLSYTRDHEWVRVDGTHERRVRIGITDYAQQALGDIVFTNLPAPGEQVEAGQSIGEVESTKSVSDVYAPLSGTVAARNEALEAEPELINRDPYGDGWMLELDLAEDASLDGLLSSDAYDAEVAGQ